MQTVKVRLHHLALFKTIVRGNRGLWLVSVAALEKKAELRKTCVLLLASTLESTSVRPTDS